MRLLLWRSSRMSDVASDLRAQARAELGKAWGDMMDLAMLDAAMGVVRPEVELPVHIRVPDGQASYPACMGGAGRLSSSISAVTCIACLEDQGFSAQDRANELSARRDALLREAR